MEGCLTDRCTTPDGEVYHFVEWDAGVDAPDGYVHEDYLLVGQDASDGEGRWPPAFCVAADAIFLTRKF